MTIIDPSKVNLLEVDIEDWLYANPNLVKLSSYWVVDRWIGRQFKVPSGIIDLIGISYSPFAPRMSIVVVEVKNADINQYALTQVSRYAADIQSICDRTEPFYWYDDNWDVIKVVVGQSINDSVYREALAVEVIPLTFSVSLNLSLSGISWKKEYIADLIQRYEEMGKDEQFTELAKEVKHLAVKQNSDELTTEFEEAIKNVIKKEEDDSD